MKTLTGNMSKTHFIIQILMKIRNCDGLSSVYIYNYWDRRAYVMVVIVWYSIQHYVIKFVSDLREVGSFLRFPPPIKLTTMI